MKKYGLLLLVVLAMSTAAWAGPFACVTVPRCVPACEEITVITNACLPFDCELAGPPRVCIRGALIMVDWDFTCDNCMCGPATCIKDAPATVGPLCPGMYIVLVRINCQCCGPCCLFRPRICAMGSAFFQAVCCDQSQPDPPSPPDP